MLGIQALSSASFHGSGSTGVWTHVQWLAWTHIARSATLPHAGCERNLEQSMNLQKELWKGNPFLVVHVPFLVGLERELQIDSN